MYKEQFDIKIIDSDFDSRFKLSSSITTPKKIKASLVILKGELILTIYSNRMCFFAEKFDKWLRVNTYSYNLEQLFTVCDVKGKNNLAKIIFSKSKVISWELGSNNFENGLHYFPIKLSAIELLYNSNTSNTSKFTSEVYLHKESLNIIEDFYIQPSFAFSPKIWKLKKKYEKPIVIGPVQVEFDIQLNSYKEGHEYIISQTPIYKIHHDGISNELIQKHASIIEILLSLISVNWIPNKFLIHKNINSIYKLFKTEKNIQENITKRYFSYNENTDLHHLLLDLNLDVLDDIEFIREVSKKYIFSRNIIGSGKFMLLFSIIEKFRDKYCQENSVKEKFTYSIPRKRVNEKIRTALEEIGSLIKNEVERKLFEKNIDSNINFLKLLPQSIQMENLLSFIGINNDQNFDEVLTMRHKIFHGAFVREDNSDLKELNSNLDDIVVKLFLFYLSKKRES